MHEIQERMSKVQWRLPHYAAGASLFVVGIIAGRIFFPLEVNKPFIIEKRVEVPVERVVVKMEPIEVVRYVDRVVERRVEVPVEVVKVVERRVEVPVSRSAHVETRPPVLPEYREWSHLRNGLAMAEVRALLGSPDHIESSAKITWTYRQAGAAAAGFVRFGPKPRGVDAQIYAIMGRNRAGAELDWLVEAFEAPGH
jgi:hypothetical protein